MHPDATSGVSLSLCQVNMIIFNKHFNTVLFLALQKPFFGFGLRFRKEKKIISKTQHV